MGKRAIVVVLVILLCFPAIYKADTVSDIFTIYGIDKRTELNEAQTELNDVSSTYTSLVKEYSFASFYNTAVSLTDSTKVMNELNEQQFKLQELEVTLLSSIDASREDIISYCNEYKATHDYVDFLLEALDSYRGITSVPTKDDDLYILESELVEAQSKFDTLETASNIGDVKNLIHPVQAIYEVQSGYGTRTTLNDASKTESHDGIDLAAPQGTGVLSLFAGVVIFADYEEGKGETVRISHGDGVVTEYRHLEERYVQEGMTLQQYQKIGTIGISEGNPHLHLSIYIDGQTYDPAKLFKKENGNNE